MILNKTFPYNPSYKLHIFIGVMIGALLSFILISLQPFNLNNFDNPYGEILLIGFGFSEFVNYILSHLSSIYFFRKKRHWFLWDEIVFICLSSLSGVIIGYLYLDVVFEHQSLSFKRFILFFYVLSHHRLFFIIIINNVVRKANHFNFR